MDFDPGEVRIPGNVDLPSQESLHLAVVIGKKHVINRRANFAKIIAHAFPDWNHTRVIRYRAYQDGFRHEKPQNNGISKRVLATKSYRTSVVGAMIAAARA